MRRRAQQAGLLLGCILAAGTGRTQEGRLMKPPRPVPPTLVLESRAAIDRGVGFLLDRQLSDGSWMHSPAVTGLACIALHNGVAPSYGLTRVKAVDKGRAFILANVHDDGAICPRDRSYINYSTSICLTALAIMGNPADIEVMKRARAFLLGLQLHEDHPEHPTDKRNPFYGGIGYGSRGPARPDLSNTQLALEALYVSDYLAREPYVENDQEAERTDLAWERAVTFLEAVQNLQKTEGGGWIVTDEKDGGFVYQPDQSKASERHDDAGSLRSYGSMTYAGLKSMIYAQLQRDDPRVQAAVEWAGRHYTLDENPGMGAEGHFYYLQTLAKAHAAYGEEVLETAQGERRHWRTDVIRKLLALQKGDGGWINEKSGRWQESIPELVTCYALISLEIALGKQLRQERD